MILQKVFCLHWGSYSHTLLFIVKKTSLRALTRCNIFLKTYNEVRAVTCYKLFICGKKYLKKIFRMRNNKQSKPCDSLAFPKEYCICLVFKQLHLC